VGKQYSGSSSSTGQQDDVKHNPKLHQITTSLIEMQAVS
jgi:hypothetical protein